MPVPAIPGVPPFATHEDLVNSVTKIRGELVNLLLNLDTLNVVSLDAKVITAESITGDKIAADAITAEKIDVDQLSAISADMGTLTAGEIYGALIATAIAGSYPRIEFSSANNLLDAQGNATDRVYITPDNSGTPTMVFTESSTYFAQIFLALGTLFINALPGTGIQIASDLDLTLQAGTGYFVRIQDWDRFYSTGDSQTLQQALDSLSTDIGTLNTSVTALTSALATKATAGSSTGSAGPFNGGIPIGTVLSVAGGGTVTWAGIGAHSHTQT